MKQTKNILASTAIAGTMIFHSGIGNAQSNSDSTAIRSFTVHIPQKKLTDLRNRIKATRWPDKEIVTNQSQGVQLSTMQKLAKYWTTDYDWRNAEAKLNALPQYVTNIDGVDIYFIHV